LFILKSKKRPLDIQYREQIDRSDGAISVQ